MRNVAFIDCQNLYFGIKEDSWELDFKKFRVYLKDKLKVEEAYYFMGYVDENYQDLYDNL